MKISEDRQGKVDNAEMQETCYTFAEKLEGNDMNEKQEPVIRTLSYLEEHLQGTLSLQTVVQLMQYSSYHLHHSFTQLYDMWMHDYVKRRRINEAARCLYETDVSILEIAISYGYESSQALSQAFKQLYKTTCVQFHGEQRCYALQYPLQLYELNQTESAMRELQIRQAIPRDMDIWMQLMRQAMDFFPYLEEAVYEQQLLKCMKQKEAFLAPFEKTALAATQLQLKSGQIDVPVIYPQLCCLDAVKQLIEWMQCTCAPHTDLVITCFRAADRADAGYRRFLLEAGFVYGEELVGLGYPVQRLYYRRTQDV